MKIHPFPALLALVLSTSGASAAESRFGETQRFLFYSVLEGLYEDGVSTKDVERILMRHEERAYYYHFVHACPVCMGAVWAFDAYRRRPEGFHGVKSGGSTFGWGLGKKIRDALHSDDVERRLSAINTLIGRWIDRRMDKLRLTKEERAELAEKLEEKRELGSAMLNKFRGDGGSSLGIHAPAYQGQDAWECAVCRAAVGKPMQFGESTAPNPGTEGADQPASAQEPPPEGDKKPQPEPESRPP